MKEFIETLLQLNRLFDSDAEVVLDSENNAIHVTGHDYARDEDGTVAEPGAVGGILENQSASLERSYSAELIPLDENDWTKGYQDTINPLIQTIISDNRRMYDSRPRADK